MSESKCINVAELYGLILILTSRKMPTCTMLQKAVSTAPKAELRPQRLCPPCQAPKTVSTAPKAAQPSLTNSCQTSFTTTAALGL